MPIATREELMPRAPIEDEETYQGLRGRGESKEQSGWMPSATAATPAGQVGRKGGRSAPYNWTKQDLVTRAREIGIEGRSRMSKTELIKALRDH